MKLHTNENDGSIYENFSDMIFGTLIIFIVFVLVIVVKTKNLKPTKEIETVEIVKIVEKPVEIIKEVVKEVIVTKEVVKIVEKPVEIVKYIERPVVEEIAQSVNKNFTKRHISIEKQDGIVYINTGSVKFTPAAFNEIVKYIEGGLNYEIDNYVNDADGKNVETLVKKIQKNDTKIATISYKVVDNKIKIGRMIMSIDDKNKLINDFGLVGKEI